jgi:chromosome segregation ATPase
VADVATLELQVNARPAIAELDKYEAQTVEATKASDRLAESQAGLGAQMQRAAVGTDKARQSATELAEGQAASTLHIQRASEGAAQAAKGTAQLTESQAGLHAQLQRTSAGTDKARQSTTELAASQAASTSRMQRATEGTTQAARTTEQLAASQASLRAHLQRTASGADKARQATKGLAESQAGLGAHMQRTAAGTEKAKQSEDIYARALRERLETHREVLALKPIDPGVHAEALRMNAAFDKLNKTVPRSTAGIGRLNNALFTMLRRATGSSTVLTQLTDVLGTFALGVGKMTAIVGTTVALAFAYRKLTEDTRKAKEETEKFTEALGKLREEQGISDAGGARVLQVESQQEVSRGLANQIRNLAGPGDDPEITARIRADLNDKLRESNALIASGLRDLNEVEEERTESLQRMTEQQQRLLAATAEGQEAVDRVADQIRREDSLRENLAGVTDDQRESVTEMTNAYWDAVEATESLATAQAADTVRAYRIQHRRGGCAGGRLYVAQRRGGRSRDSSSRSRSRTDRKRPGRHHQRGHRCRVRATRSGPPRSYRGREGGQRPDRTRQARRRPRDDAEDPRDRTRRGHRRRRHRRRCR